MDRRSIIIGVAGGLLIGGLLVTLWQPNRPAPVPLAPLAEDQGRLARVVMQYHPQAGEAVARIYRQFLAAAGDDLEVIWAVDKRADLDDLKARLSPGWPARSRSLIVGKGISTWSKDRFAVLAPSGGGGQTMIVAPARKTTANPLRTNDQEVPYRLAERFGELFACKGLTIDFDGGDLLFAGGRAFASPAIIEKNPQFGSADELRDYLSGELNHEVIWLGPTPQDAPPHHIGMYLTIIGGAALVGDVRLAEAVAATQPDAPAALEAAGGPAPASLRADLIVRLDKTAGQMASLGYRVVRVPLLPSASEKAWMSYNNGIIETRDGATIFYMPTFGLPALDAAAADAFRAAVGCRVVPIDCSAIWPLGGSLHCLVNVVGRQ